MLFFFCFCFCIKKKGIEFFLFSPQKHILCIFIRSAPNENRSAFNEMYLCEAFLMSNHVFFMEKKKKKENQELLMVYCDHSSKVITTDKELFSSEKC